MDKQTLLLRGSNRFLSLFILSVLVLALVPPASSLGGVTLSEERASYYFRLKAQYSHDGRPVSFDIVVACNNRVTRYRGGESGFLATRYPRFFVQRTHDGREVMQIVPIACRGETTEDGRVPTDFLPGAIWFDTPGDYRFGIAYVSEDAFENPNSQLKFHGASIHKATRAEWDAFKKRAANNEGLRKRYYDRPAYTTEDARQIVEGRGNEVEAAYVRGCSGVRRYKLSEAGRAIVRDSWPADKPRFWASNGLYDGPWPELQQAEKETPIFANGLRYIEHFIGSSYEYAGFPTRTRGGMIYSGSYKYAPAEFFPVRNQRGVPWVFTGEVAKSRYLTANVELNSGMGRGFFYCYTMLSPGQGGLGKVLPDFRSRQSRVRVDGEWVVTPKPRQWSWPSPFFERDEYIYFLTGIGLS